MVICQVGQTPTRHIHPIATTTRTACLPFRLLTLTHTSVTLVCQCSCDGIVTAVCPTRSRKWDTTLPNTDKAVRIDQEGGTDSRKQMTERVTCERLRLPRHNSARRITMIKQTYAVISELFSRQFITPQPEPDSSTCITDISLTNNVSEIFDVDVTFRKGTFSR